MVRYRQHQHAAQRRLDQLGGRGTAVADLCRLVAIAQVDSATAAGGCLIQRPDDACIGDSAERRSCRSVAVRADVIEFGNDGGTRQ